MLYTVQVNHLRLFQWISSSCALVQMLVSFSKKRKNHCSVLLGMYELVLCVCTLFTSLLSLKFCNFIDMLLPQCMSFSFHLDGTFTDFTFNGILTDLIQFLHALFYTITKRLFLIHSLIDPKVSKKKNKKFDKRHGTSVGKLFSKNQIRMYGFVQWHIAWSRK